MPPLARLLLLTVGILAVGGCDSPSSSEDRGSLTPGNPATFQVRGILQKLSPEGRKAVIAHEAIDGYMAKMTMEFELADPREAAQLEPGDLLDFRLSVTDRKSWIDQIRKTGHTELPAQVGTPPASGDLSRVIPPSPTLIDQQGRPFRLSDLRGRVVALTFIFTRCPLPNFCPLMSRHFGDVQRELGATVPAERWRLLSVTIDPAHDTPEVLAEYAKKFGADPAQWIFATGAIADIKQIGSVFGLEYSGDGAALAHNLRTVVIGADGRIRRIFEGNEWQPAELTAAMQGALAESR